MLIQFSPSSRKREAYGPRVMRDPAQGVCTALVVVPYGRTLRWVPALVAAEAPLHGQDDEKN